MALIKKTFPLPKLSFTEWRLYQKEECITISIPGEKHFLKLDPESDTRYASLFKNSWLPLSLAATEPVFLDRNILIDLEHNRDGYKDLLKHLQHSEKIRLDLALLEGDRRENKTTSYPSILEMRKDYDFWFDVFQRHGLSTKLYRFDISSLNAYQSVLQENASNHAFIKNCGIPSFLDVGEERLSAMETIIQCAKEENISCRELIVLLVLSSIFIRTQEHGKRDKHASVGTLKLKNGRISDPYNLIADLNAAVLYKILNTHAGYRFLTSDEALINLCLNMDWNEKMSINLQYFFPNITPREKALLKSNGIAFNK